MDPGPLGSESTLGRAPFLSGAVCPYVTPPTPTTTTHTHAPTQRLHVPNAEIIAHP